ncbi:MAG: metallophosphoesterase family protein [Ichthyobacteriaceae bacterium]|nr:metallophosphoesterase family protein [Ichthyobacteriaceae bacterium]
MKILLMSDTHGCIDDVMIKYINTVDEVWHAGDIGTVAVTDKIKELKPLKGVYGNIDGTDVRSEFPLHNRFIVDGVDVWITHIGGYPGNYAFDIRKEITNNPPRLFISGHSHILKVMNDNKLGLLHMNPGAIGRKGFHHKRTMLRFEIIKSEIKNLEVIELGDR